MNINELTELNHLDKSFNFYIADTMHNFGVSSIKKEIKNIKTIEYLLNNKYGISL